MTNITDCLKSPPRRPPGWYWAIIALNIAVWLWAMTLFHGQPELMGSVFLAWMFGLRHAVDVDHIAAIDNATRKLLYDGRHASGAEFFFSLGHASVVIIMCAVVAVGTHILQHHIGEMQAIGGLISTLASALFLLLLAMANLLISFSVFKTFRAARQGGILIEQDLALLLQRQGGLARIFRPLFNLISALLNKSNFQEIDGSDRYSPFSIGSPWQSKSLKSPTGLPTTRRSGSAVR